MPSVLICFSVGIFMTYCSQAEGNNVLLTSLEQEDHGFLCIENIVAEFCRSEAMFFYDYPNDIVDRVSKILPDFGVRIVNVLSEEIHFTHSALFHMLVIHEANHVAKYFNALYRSWEFSSDMRYFVVYLGGNDLDVVFRNFYKGYLKKVLLLHNSNTLYTTQSFEENCGRNMTKEYLSSCEQVTNYTLHQIYDDNYSNLFGCEVRVLPVIKPPFIVNPDDPNFPGIEPELIALAAKAFNFTVNYLDGRNLSWGHKLPNGTYNRMVERLFKKEGDVMLGNFRTDSTFLEDFQACKPYVQSSLAFYVPAGISVNDWNAMVKVFGKYVWITIIVMQFVITFVFFLASKTHTYTILDSFKIFLGQAAVQPKTLILRTLFLCWVLFAYVFMSSYVSVFLSFLIHPTRRYQINSVDEIFRSSLKFGGLRYGKDLFARLDPQEYDDWIECPLDTGCLNRTAFERNMATLEDTDFVNYHIKYYYDDSGQKLVHQLPVSYRFYSWIILNKGYPIQEPINKMISRVAETGLLSKVMLDYVVREMHQSPGSYRSISMEQLKLPFYILLGGNGLAILAFLGEIFHLMMRKTNMCLK